MACCALLCHRLLGQIQSAPDYAVISTYLQRNQVLIGLRYINKHFVEPLFFRNFAAAYSYRQAVY